MTTGTSNHDVSHVICIMKYPRQIHKLLNAAKVYDGDVSRRLVVNRGEGKDLSIDECLEFSRGRDIPTESDKPSVKSAKKWALGCVNPAS